LGDWERGREKRWRTPGGLFDCVFVIDSKRKHMESKQPVTKADLEALKADLVEAMHGMLHETETKLLTALNASADLLTQ